MGHTLKLFQPAMERGLIYYYARVVVSNDIIR